jgi:hypothetical protein
LRSAFRSLPILSERSQRFGEIGKSPEMLAAIHSEHLRGLVTKRGDEEPFSFHIGAEAIDSAIDILQFKPACPQLRFVAPVQE